MNVPRRSLGFVFRHCRTVKNCDSIVQLKAFLDPSSLDSKRAFPVLIDLGNKLSERNFELVFQPFPFPWNRNSHNLTKTLHVVHFKTKGAGVIPFLEKTFEEIGSLTTEASRGKTDDEMLDFILNMAGSVTGDSVDGLKTEFSKRSYEMVARLDFKYCCTRAVFATPTFMVNDITIVADQTFSLQDWISVIDPLL